MDPNQFKAFMEHQAQMMTQLMQGLNATAATIAARAATQIPATPQVPQMRLPSPLVLEGDMTENMDFFEKSWNNYVKATKMDSWPAIDNQQKVSILLSVIGEPARKKFFNFELTEAQRNDPDAALTAIRDKVTPKRNVILDRLEFFSATQFSRESTDDFATRLKILAHGAKLGNLMDELVTYKLVTANKWPQIRSKMLAIPDITIDKAVDMCRAEEITTKRCQDLAIQSMDSKSESEIKKVRKSKSRPKPKTLHCKFCGDQHEFSKGVCPALGKRCNRCKGRNHFERVCKAKRKSYRGTRRVKEIKDDSSESEESSASQDDASSEDSEPEYEIGKIFDCSERGGCVVAELELKFCEKWKKIKCELDTGANTSLIGQNYLVKQDKEENLVMLPSKLRLQSFGGSPIKVLGQVKVPCRRKGRKYSLVLQVVEGDHCPLLSAKASRVLGFVKFCKSVTFGGPNPAVSSENLLKVYRVHAQKIVDTHKELFTGYGKLVGEVSLEVDNSISPSIQTPRRVPIALRSKLKAELEMLEREEIIVKETTHTDWVSNILIVQRGDPAKQSIRVCLDPVPLNKALKRPNLQFVTIDEILPELGKAKVFSTVDAKKGFWHVVLDEASSKLTTFWTPFGRYRWTRLPFGIAPAPEIFQMKLQETIQDLEGVECIADDILIFGIGDSLEEALSNHNLCLEKLLCRLEKHNVKLNREKLKLCQTSVKFYGHILTDKGLQPDESKIATIRNYPTPTDRKEVHRFIGMVNYLSRFIPNLSANLTNMRKLISESQPWKWTPTEAAEFHRVKSLVSDIGTLQYYDVNQPITIECDASCFGLGAVVYQSSGVIAYASRTLTATERNYAQIEKELLAILFACIRFDQLIVGNPKAVIKTDHKPLLNIFEKPLLSAPRRLQHMLLSLQRYNLSMEFVTGKENVVADALSRAPIADDQPTDRYKKLCIYKIFREIEDVELNQYLSISDSRLSEIMDETAKDPTMQQIIDYVNHGWPHSITRVPDNVKIYYSYRDELATQSGIVFRGDRIVVPYALRRKLIDCCHVSHNGIEATLKLARANLFWPGMNSQIKEVVKSCNVCAKFSASQANPPMKSHIIPIHPFQLISMDVFFAEYEGRKRALLVTVDHYSDFFEVNILRDLTPHSVISACQQNFARHGTPQRVLTDNATNFVNRPMVEFAKHWDFELVTSAPYHQQANGKSEAAVKIAKRLLVKATETGTNFWYALLHWRNIPNKIGSSPSARLFSRSTRCSVPCSAANLLPKIVKDVPESIEENRRKVKHRYDQKTRHLPDMETGSPVFVQLSPDTSKIWTPGTISKRLNDRSYCVAAKGKEYRRSLVHIKPRIEETAPSARTAITPKDNEGIVPREPRTVMGQRTNNNIDDEVSSEVPNTICSPPAFSPSSLSVSPSLSALSTSTVKPTESRIPSISDKVTRPKRVIKIPEKLKDYDLN